MGLRIDTFWDLAGAIDFLGLNFPIGLLESQYNSQFVQSPIYKTRCSSF